MMCLQELLDHVLFATTLKKLRRKTPAVARASPLISWDDIMFVGTKRKLIAFVFMFAQTEINYSHNEKGIHVLVYGVTKFHRQMHPWYVEICVGYRLQVSCYFWSEGRASYFRGCKASKMESYFSCLHLFTWVPANHCDGSCWCTSWLPVDKVQEEPEKCIFLTKIFNFVYSSEGCSTKFLKIKYL